MKLGEIQFSKNIPARGSLFLLEETIFQLVETIFFLHASETPASDFFSSSRKVFFSKITHSRNNFFLEFFFLVETVTEIKPILKSDHILTNEN